MQFCLVKHSNSFTNRYMPVVFNTFCAFISSLKNSLFLKKNISYRHFFCNLSILFRYDSFLTPKLVLHTPVTIRLKRNKPSLWFFHLHSSLTYTMAVQFLFHVFCILSIVTPRYLCSFTNSIFPQLLL